MPKIVIPPWLSPMASQWHNWQSYYFRQMSLENSHQDIKAEIIIPFFSRTSNTSFDFLFPFPIYYFMTFAVFSLDGKLHISKYWVYWSKNCGRWQSFNIKCFSRREQLLKYIHLWKIFTMPLSKQLPLWNWQYNFMIK